MHDWSFHLFSWNLIKTYQIGLRWNFFWLTNYWRNTLQIWLCIQSKNCHDIFLMKMMKFQTKLFIVSREQFLPGKYKNFCGNNRSKTEKVMSWHNLRTELLRSNFGFHVASSTTSITFLIRFSLLLDCWYRCGCHFNDLLGILLPRSDKTLDRRKILNSYVTSGYMCK